MRRTRDLRPLSDEEAARPGFPFDGSTEFTEEEGEVIEVLLASPPPAWLRERLARETPLASDERVELEDYRRAYGTLEGLRDELRGLRDELRGLERRLRAAKTALEGA